MTHTISITGTARDFQLLSALREFSEIINFDTIDIETEIEDKGKFEREVEGITMIITENQ